MSTRAEVFNPINAVVTLESTGQTPADQICDQTRTLCIELLEDHLGNGVKVRKDVRERIWLTILGLSGFGLVFVAGLEEINKRLTGNHAWEVNDQVGWRFSLEGTNQEVLIRARGSTNPGKAHAVDIVNISGEEYISLHKMGGVIRRREIGDPLDKNYSPEQNVLRRAQIQDARMWFNFVASLRQR